MTVSHTSNIRASDVSLANGPIPVELLAREVYDEATPSVQRRMLALLVGKVFESAPLAMRAALVRELMRPLGVLSLMPVANGVFAHIRLCGGLADGRILAEELQGVSSRDVAELAMHAQQLKLEVLEGLAPILAAGPMPSPSSAATLLQDILDHRATGHGLN